MFKDVFRGSFILVKKAAENIPGRLENRSLY